METVRIAGLLRPFLEANAGREELSQRQLQQLSDYLDLLLRWNAKTNLTSVRQPEEIVTRHFGESLFLARNLNREELRTAIDFGSGAGFPGIPLKIHSPQLAVTLMESQNKKATFLNETIRKLTLMNINVFSGRAEESNLKADLVTLRAVEKFELAVRAAVDLLNPSGMLALLIGAGQVASAQAYLNGFAVGTISVPGSQERVLLTAFRTQG